MKKKIKTLRINAQGGLELTNNGDDGEIAGFWPLLDFLIFCRLMSFKICYLARPLLPRERTWDLWKMEKGN